MVCSLFAKEIGATAHAASTKDGEDATDDGAGASSDVLRARFSQRTDAEQEDASDKAQEDEAAGQAKTDNLVVERLEVEDSREIQHEEADDAEGSDRKDQREDPAGGDASESRFAEGQIVTGEGEQIGREEWREEEEEGDQEQDATANYAKESK